MVVVSIIVPMYKVEPYLNRCISSLCSQTLQDIEIILVNDGSPDKCGEIAEAYARKDNRIKVVHKENGGLASARNAGLEIARGSYVGFVDPDDWVELNMFEEMYTRIQQFDADMAVCNVYDEFPNRTAVSLSLQDKVFSLKKIPFETYAAQRFVNSLGSAVWHKLYKKSILDSLKLKFISEREVASEDIPFNFSFFLQADKICTISKCLYHYVRRENSLATTFKPNLMKQYMVLCQTCWDFALTHGYKHQAEKLIPFMMLALIKQALNKNANTYVEKKKQLEIAAQYNIFHFSMRVLEKGNYRIDNRISAFLLHRNMFSLAVISIVVFNKGVLWANKILGR